MQEFDEVSLCSSVKQVIYMMSIMTDVSNNFDLKNCECPVKCQEILYRLQDEKILNSEDDLYTVPENDSEIEYHLFVYEPESSLSIEIFESRIPVVEEDKSYSWLSLCCDLGGTMGLWLGICGLQVAEIITTVIFRWTVRLMKNPHEGNEASKKHKPYIVVMRAFPATQNGSIDMDLPGIQNVYNKSLPLWVRVMWFVVYTAVLGFGLYQCYQRISYYLSEPTITKTHYEHKTDASLPSVTICPDNNDGSQPAVNPYLFRLQFDQFSSVENLLDSGTLSVQDVWNLASINANGLGLTSETRYEKKRNGKIDSPEVHTTLGTCLRINADENLKSTAAGKEQKISIAGNNSAIPLIRIIFHQPEEEVLLNYLPNFRGYRIKPFGYHNFIITFAESIYQNTKNHPCTDSQTAMKCISKCLETIIISRIPCRLPFMQNSADISLCSNKRSFKLVMNTTITVLEKRSDKKCNCPRSCREILYTLAQRSCITSADVDNIIEINMKYQENGNMVIQEYYGDSIFSVCSDVGGALGLFLGFCMLEFIQVLSKICLKFIKICKMCVKVEQQQRQRQSFHHNAVFLQQRTIVLRGLWSKPSQQVGSHDITVPGFDQVMNKGAPIWARLSWCLISVIATVACVYQCSERIMYFWNDPSDIIVYYYYNKTLHFPIMVMTPPHERINRATQKMHRYLQAKNYKYKLPPWTVDEMWKARFNITGIQTFANEEEKTDLMTVSEMYTLGGVAIVAQPKNPVRYNGTHTSLSVKISIVDALNGGLTELTSGFAKDDIGRIPYDVYNNPTTIGVAVNLPTRSSFFSYQQVEVVRRNTAQHPCSDAGTSVNCVVKCLEEKIDAASNSSCRNVLMQKSSLVPACKTAKEAVEVYVTAKSLVVEFNFNSPEDCSCPRQCKSLLYTNQRMVPVFRQLSNQFQEISVTIPDNRIQVVSEEPAYTFIKLLSDIGGTLGLYFGFGLLQMFEIIVNLLLKFRPLTDKKRTL